MSTTLRAAAILCCICVLGKKRNQNYHQESFAILPEFFPPEKEG
jgi:hypothetical protein